MTTPPQFSPDGQWWWDGQGWVPAAQAPQPPQTPAPQPQAPQAPWATPQQPAGQAPWATPAAGTPGAPSEQTPWGTPAPGTQGEQGAPQQPPWGEAPQQPPWGEAPQQPGWGAAPQQPGWGTAPQQPGWGTPTYPPYGTPPPKSDTDGKAIGSLVASLVWACGVGSVVGVILGHVSRSQAKREGREPSGLALAGLLLGYLGLVGMLVVGLVIVAFKDPIVDAVQNDLELQSASDAQQSLHDASGRYATSLEELRTYGYSDYDGKVDVRIISATDTSYCMSARSFGETYYASDEEPTTSTTPCG